MGTPRSANRRTHTEVDNILKALRTFSEYFSPEILRLRWYLRSITA